VPDTVPPPGEANDDAVSDAGRAAAAEALRAAFARLSPQGSDPWNFRGAFNQLADRYGPDHPGDSATAEALRAAERPLPRSGRLRRRNGGSGADTGSTAELGDAMAIVVEAFRWLSARVSTLEERLAREDAPLDGPAWFAPDPELGDWVPPVMAHLAAAAPSGEVLHGDCGAGALLAALAELAGSEVTPIGAEPRGAVALEALERGHHVTIAETAEVLAGRPAGSLGGLVMSGVVDRLPLHELVGLLRLARSALGPGAPIVIVATEPSGASPEPVAGDLFDGLSLHSQTWMVLLDRAGFVDVVPLAGPGSPPGRLGLTASVPA
jgi:hypothetical protein